MKMSIEERVKALEKKVLVLEGGTLLKEESGNPYKSKSNKETKPFEKDNE